MLRELIYELKLQKNPEKAKILSRFFKTGKGEYAEGDKFLGIIVPIQRKIAKKYYSLTLEQLQQLLDSTIHEHRFTALVILINKYNGANSQEKERIVNFYIDNFHNISNWDLVDISCPNIIGDYFLNKPKRKLYEWSDSNHLWTKRISIVSTLKLIKNNQFQPTLDLAEKFIEDTHDLIHKASGWMLRELGKRNQEVLESFLNKHSKRMPRTMLRYSIERLSPSKRQKYMKR
ncbi:DNA alkylation repair protein [archaeon]|jgi:3-methyladenine DNA glycosylase AlkD|nr:DNA alkylation repair protein [archaeon]MBT3438528.1 DNA alkylation repair protein [Candidatus Woesearchaeota archaeon]MBT4058051.1 DNA alkylation repair protein [Candidatus Woesearchaeota archaeon]MBT4208335.1 DNA alkylation repair protein [Candidatus Woesearchaeota archaeon]MBT4730824.1 DNA alkylation repair protein [Candidatus Woesearchaeota archaeon]